MQNKKSDLLNIKIVLCIGTEIFSKSQAYIL